MASMELMVVIGFFGGFAVLVIGSILIGKHLERKRRDALADVAGSIGLDFDAAGDVVSLDSLAGLHLFSLGHDRRVGNVLHGRRGRVDVLIFDYRYTIGTGKNRSVYQQSVAAFPADESVPQFAVRPENIFHKIGAAFGYQDIDFPAHPEFSRRFVVRGPNGGAIRWYFTEPRIQAMMSAPMSCFEAANGWFVVYQSRRRCKPEELADFIDAAVAVYQAVVARR